MKKINNFVALDSVHGKFIVNRQCFFQAEHIIKTGQTHIETELQKILAIAQFLPKECVVVDAGANCGLISIPIAQAITSKNGVVHAFEPQRMLAYALCGAVSLNDLNNIFVHNKGLGSCNEILDLSMPDYSVAQDFGLYSIPKATQNPTDKVIMTTIDSLDLPHLDLLKIDVEGMEIDVLKGAQAMLKNHQPWCWVEHWMLTIDDIKQQFSGLNYKFYVMDELNLLCVPEIRSNTVNLTIKAKQV